MSPGQTPVCTECSHQGFVKINQIWSHLTSTAETPLVISSGMGALQNPTVNLENCLWTNTQLFVWSHHTLHTTTRLVIISQESASNSKIPGGPMEVGPLPLLIRCCGTIFLVTSDHWTLSSLLNPSSKLVCSNVLISVVCKWQHTNFSVSSRIEL